jgi:hypothetical protein
MNANLFNFRKAEDESVWCDAEPSLRDALPGV